MPSSERRRLDRDSALLLCLIAACVVPSALAFNEGNDLGWLAPEAVERPARDARPRHPPERIGLIQAGGNAQTPLLAADREQTLRRASAAGDLATVRDLLDAGVNPNLGDDSNDVPLLAAVRADHADVVQLLLDRGARTDVKARGEIPLVRAVKNGNRVVVLALLAARADPDRRGDDGDTALHSAVRMGHPDLIALLARAQPDYRVFDREGLTPLGLAASIGQLAAAQALIDAGAPLELGDRKRRPPLWYAFSVGDFDMARRLLKNGAAPGGLPVETLN